MIYDRGTIILVYFPFSDHRSVKQRPALVVQANDVRPAQSQIIVAQITSNMHRVGPPSRVVVRLGSPLAAGTGLRTDSVIVMDNLATIHRSLIKGAIGRVSDMSVLDAALKRALAL